MKKVWFIVTLLAATALGDGTFALDRKDPAKNKRAIQSSPSPTPSATPAPQPTPTPPAAVSPASSLLFDMKLNEWGQLAAWLAALFFFGYKLLTGYLITDMSVKIACERKHKNEKMDYLAIAVTIKKGERGGVQIHDGQAWVRSLPGVTPVELIGIRRMDQSDPAPRATIQWTERDSRLNLPPGDEMQFAALLEVPCCQAFVVETAILAKKLWRIRNKVGQWRACVVSLPHDPPTP